MPNELAPKRREARPVPLQEEELEEEDEEQTIRKLHILLKPERSHPVPTLLEDSNEQEVITDADTELSETSSVTDEVNESNQAPHPPEPTSTAAAPTSDIEEEDRDDLTLENESPPGSPVRDLSPSGSLAQSPEPPLTPTFRVLPIPAPRTTPVNTFVNILSLLFHSSYACIFLVCQPECKDPSQPFLTPG